MFLKNSIGLHNSMVYKSLFCNNFNIQQFYHLVMLHLKTQLHKIVMLERSIHSRPTPLIKLLDHRVSLQTFN